MQGERSLRTLAKELKLSAAYVSDVLRGNREPGPKILAPLHLRRVKTTVIYYVKERA
jgi:transcriptional regulator with XRE-family HTH domain